MIKQQLTTAVLVLSSKHEEHTVSPVNLAGQYVLTHDFIIAGLQKAAPRSVYLEKLESYEFRIKNRSAIRCGSHGNQEGA